MGIIGFVGNSWVGPFLALYGLHLKVYYSPFEAHGSPMVNFLSPLPQKCGPRSPPWSKPTRLAVRSGLRGPAHEIAILARAGRRLRPSSASLPPPASAPPTPSSTHALKRLRRSSSSSAPELHSPVVPKIPELRPLPQPPPAAPSSAALSSSRRCPLHRPLHLPSSCRGEGGRRE